VQKFQELRIPFLTIVFFFVVLFLYTQIFGPLTLKINSQPNLFYVDGVGSEAGIPNSSIVTLGVSEKGSSIENIQNSLNSKSNKIVNALKDLGIKADDIKTINYSVSPSYNQTPSLSVGVKNDSETSSPNQELSQFEATQEIEVKADDIKLLNKAIDVATQNGANIISGVSFRLDDQAREKLEDIAREEAIKNAKEKAKRIAKSSGLRLGKLVNVSDQGSFPYALDQSAASKTERQVSTELNPGETTVRINVTLTYETL
jgi:uncharacterized protein YggE